MCGGSSPNNHTRPGHASGLAREFRVEWNLQVPTVKTLSHWLARLSSVLMLGITVHAQPATVPLQPEWIEYPGPSAGPTFFRKSFQAQPALLKAILLGA